MGYLREEFLNRQWKIHQFIYGIQGREHFILEAETVDKELQSYIYSFREIVFFISNDSNSQELTIYVKNGKLYLKIYIVEMAAMIEEYHNVTDASIQYTGSIKNPTISLYVSGKFPLAIKITGTLPNIN